MAVEVSVAIITACLAAIFAVVAFFYSRYNVADLRGIIDELRKDNKRHIRRETIYLKRVIYLMAGIRALIEQIERRGEKPCWTPEDWDPDQEEAKLEGD